MKNELAELGGIQDGEALSKIDLKIISKFWGMEDWEKFLAWLDAIEGKSQEVLVGSTSNLEELAGKLEAKEYLKYLIGR